jgi:tripartite-type tricarboxylate transporter receptor subunit TctC
MKPIRRTRPAAAEPTGAAMKLNRRRLLELAALGCAMPCRAVHAAEWPSRPIRFIAGGVGGVSDIRARWLAPRLAQALGQAVVVENIAAAGGNVSAAETARSAPDGHTLLLYHQGIAAINPHLYDKPGYEPLRDLQAVTRFGHGSLLLTVPAASPVRTVGDLVALARARPGALNFGSPGNGTPPHLASELFVRMAGIEAAHVPYRGGGAMMTALLGGQLAWAIEGLTAQLPHVRSGALRAVAVTAARRAAALPEVPTIAEAGVAGYEYEGWTGLAVPAATPASIVQRLYGEVARIAAAPESANGSPPPGPRRACWRRPRWPGWCGASTRASGASSAKPA